MIIKWIVLAAAVWIGLGGILSSLALFADEYDGYISREEMWRRMVPCSLYMLGGLLLMIVFISL